jgi:hypothetical protein
MSKQLLEDEETELRDFLNNQRSLLRRYRISRWLLLGFGVVFIASALLWMAYKQADLSGLDKFVPAFTALGIGLIATAATTYPVKEILNRKERIMYCEKLLSNINSVRLEERTRKTNAERIQKKCREAVETLKEC